MKSDTTFNEEYSFLSLNIPQALDGINLNLIDFINNHFESVGLTVENDSDDLELIRLPDDLETQLFPTIGEEKKSYAMQLDEPIQQLISALTYNLIDSELGANLIAHLGTECFGCYLPMHSFYNSKTTPWGIYLFPSVIGANVNFLHNKFPHIAHKDLAVYYTWCILRHELFHFQTEQFATGMEVLFRKPYYLRYSENIYKKYSYTEDWLEEALAENSVLKSRLVTNNTSIAAKTGKDIYRYDLRRMPGGYRHYACTKFQGPNNAHKVLAAQMLHLDNINPIPTNLYTIKNQFIAKKELVPLYLVGGLKLKRIW